MMAFPETEKKSEKKEKPFTKVIVRRLPPTIDLETFLKQVSPVPNYNYIYIVNGDFSLGENAFSRVYINFVNYEDVFNFKERFDNYVFLDAKGNEYQSVVEFASFQKIPKKRGKSRMDPKAGTIESEPYYTDFLENLKLPQELEEKPEYTLQLTTSADKQDLTTPLLEYIKNKRAQRVRFREIRREERKLREFDKKRGHYDDHKKNPEDKFQPKKTNSKTETVKSGKSEDGEENAENESYDKSYYKNKDKRFNERKKEPKPRFPKKEYPDYKPDYFKEKKFDYKKEHELKPFHKKVKKYSEKREERKIEALKAEQKKKDEAQEEETKIEDVDNASNESTFKEQENTIENDPKIVKENDIEEPENSNVTETSEKEIEQKYKNPESQSQNQRRIRNKDRPTIAIYRPGMLSKRKQIGDGDSSESKDKSEDKY